MSETKVSTESGSIEDRVKRLEEQCAWSEKVAHEQQKVLEAFGVELIKLAARLDALKIS